MSAATATKPARKPRQKTLPRMGGRRNQKIEDLAEKFLTAREAWKDASRPFSTAKQLLEAAMDEARLESYEFDGKRISFKGKKKLVVEVLTKDEE
jgi:hypothetical protein